MRDVFIAVKLTECPKAKAVLKSGESGEMGANMQYFRFGVYPRVFVDFVPAPGVMSVFQYPGRQLLGNL